MSGLSGNIASLANFSANIRRLPTVVAQKVAAAAAPALTEAARATFNAGEDADGIAWTPLATGERATLKKSGSLASKVHYVAIGTKLRVALGVPYAKYQVGRRPLFPRQGAPLPPAYLRALKQATDDVCRAEFAR